MWLGVFGEALDVKVELGWIRWSTACSLPVRLLRLAHPYAPFLLWSPPRGLAQADSHIYPTPPPLYRWRPRPSLC